MKIFNKKKILGFTLIEIITTLAIIVVVFSIAIGSINRKNSRSNIKLISQTLISDLRSTAISAINSESFQLQNTTYWGVRIDASTTPTTYTIFADLDDDKDYDLNEKVKTVALSNNIKLLCTSFNQVCTITGDLVFTNDTGVTYFEGLAVDQATGNIIVQLVDSVTNEAANISINSAGAVSLE